MILISERYTIAFEELKKRLTTTHVLIVHDCSKRFKVYWDTSFKGLGCVLMQDVNVIAYPSRQLRPHEVNYPVHDIKLVVVILALKLRRHYLYGLPFKIYRDLQNLRYAFNQKEFNMRQRLWLELLGLCLEILYHPKKVNKLSYVLRRR